MKKEALDYWNRALQALETAKLLVTKDPDGGGSRAYYAAFYGVSARFALEGKSFTKHSALEAAIHRDLIKSGQWDKTLGQDFSFLRELRTTGDYGGAAHVSEAEAQEAVASAIRVLAAVQKGSEDIFEGTV